jgi:flavin-dependent dehydrogenase
MPLQNPQEEAFDAVVVGAGLAGLQCAKLLGERGFGILLVDRKQDLTKGVHTTGIFVRKTLEDFNFPAGTLGKPIRDVTLYSPSLRSIEFRSEKDEFRIGKMGKLYEAFLGECSSNGVGFLCGTRFVGIDDAQTDNWKTIKLEKNGRQLNVRTKVLIGADGANSRVAGELNLEENKEWIVGYEEVYRSNSGTGEPRLHCFLDAELAPGYLAWIADDGEDIHIGVGGYPSKFNPRAALELFKNKIAMKLADFEIGGLIETRGGRIPVGGVLRRISNEDGLLIGDAAGAVSPLTAGGLDPCLRLSAMAADVIEERLRTDDPTVMLKFSGDLFRARFVSRLWMRRIISIFTNQTLLELSCAFLRRALGKKFAEHVFFGRGSFPDIKIASNGGVLLNAKKG